MSNIDEIIRSIEAGKQFFLFINCPETHIPYDHPGMEIKTELKEKIISLYKFHDTKVNHNEPPLSIDEIDFIKEMQVMSLEYIDKKIGELIEKLPDNGRPTLALVCADH